MPLYTYIVQYNGLSYVAQGRHSNPQGFVSAWVSEVPSGALPGLTGPLRDELAGKALRLPFEPVTNRTHVWTKVIEVSGREVRVYAVQTEP